MIDPVHREAMRTRFAAIDILAQEKNQVVPKFLRPHVGTFNFHALREIVHFGDIRDILPDFFPVPTSSSPTLLQRTLPVLPVHS